MKAGMELLIFLAPLALSRPTFGSSNSACVVSTSGNCACTSNYDAVSCEDGGAVGGSYGNHQDCTFTLSEEAALVFTHFDTESGYDILTLPDHQYSGSNVPQTISTVGPLD